MLEGRRWEPFGGLVGVCWGAFGVFGGWRSVVDWWWGGGGSERWWLGVGPVEFRGVRSLWAFGGRLCATRLH